MKRKLTKKLRQKAYCPEARYIKISMQNISLKQKIKTKTGCELGSKLHITLHQLLFYFSVVSCNQI